MMVKYMQCNFGCTNLQAVAMVEVGERSKARRRHWGRLSAHHWLFLVVTAGSRLLYRYQCFRYVAGDNLQCLLVYIW